MGLFDKNGWLTKFLEAVPLVGYIPSIVHAAAGNSDEAKRASAKCTSSTIATAGALAGFPVFGAGAAVAARFIGGGFGGLAGNTVGAGISTTIHNDDVRNGAPSSSVQDCIISGALGAVSGGIGGVGSAIAPSNASAKFALESGLPEVSGGAVPQFFIDQTASAKSSGHFQRSPVEQETNGNVNVASATRESHQSRIVFLNDTGEPACQQVGYASNGKWFHLRAAGFFTLRSTHGKYVRVHPNGHVDAAADRPDHWEKLLFENAFEGVLVQIKMTHGPWKYLSARQDSSVGCTAYTPNAWEFFHLEVHGSDSSEHISVSLKTAHGKYLSAQQDGTLIANRDRVGAWEIFQLTQV